jgi:hypothetical protein
MPVRGWLKSAERRPDQNHFIKVMWWALCMKQNTDYRHPTKAQIKDEAEKICFGPS